MTEKEEKTTVRVLWIAAIVSLTACLVLFHAVREDNKRESKIINTINK
jgi:hypothetical protein